MTAPRMPNGYVQLPGGYAPQQAQGAPVTPMLPPGLDGGTPMEGFNPSALPIPARPQWNPPQLPAQPGMPGQQPAPQQGFQPAPLGTQPTGYPQQPQFVPQQPQPQFGAQQPAPQGAPAGIDPAQRLYGPGVPPNLQGRTMAEAFQIYNGMQNIVLQSLHGPQGQGPAAPPVAPLAPAPTGQQPSAIPGQSPDGAWDWRNPTAAIERTVARVIDERVAPMLAPMTQQSNLAAIRSARDAAAAQIGPAFAQVEPLVLQRLQGADPRALMSPQAWQIAAESAIGAMSLHQQRFGSQPQQQLPYAPGAQAPQQAPFGQQPLPNLNSFFSEQPNMGGPTQAPASLTPAQTWAAGQMGMSADQYRAWSATGGAR